MMLMMGAGGRWQNRAGLGHASTRFRLALIVLAVPCSLPFALLNNNPATAASPALNPNIPSRPGSVSSGASSPPAASGGRSPSLEAVGTVRVGKEGADPEGGLALVLLGGSAAAACHRCRRCGRCCRRGDSVYERNAAAASTAGVDG